MDPNSNNSHIDQVFVLSHNSYFFRLASRIGGDGAVNANLSKHLLIRKVANASIISELDSRKQLSSYQLLWTCLYDESIPDIVKPNVMRRILESYFCQHGNFRSLDDVVYNLEGLCSEVIRSLGSSINYSSHVVNDDFLDGTVQNNNVLLDTFEQIFVHHGHDAHLRMMRPTA